MFNKEKKNSIHHQVCLHVPPLYSSTWTLGSHLNDHIKFLDVVVHMPSVITSVWIGNLSYTITVGKEAVEVIALNGGGTTSARYEPFMRTKVCKKIGSSHVVGCTRCFTLTTLNVSEGMKE
ncbi:hypothetical protein MKW98_013204 [Papaver atlanticum]|uniref:Uncharacterized protein n=1 Tax=Papaver atlanticum TaxID=357466 RepID=A0AAD4SH10_9MAGN|nr:hypothetical protein MKW98_013204 [Papaver atlanticum]